MVNVSHHSDDRWSRNKVFLAVSLFAASLDLFGEVGGHKLYLVAELLGDKHKRLCVKPLVDGNHKTQIHASLDDLVDWSVVHKGGEVVHGHELGDLEDLLLGYLLCHLLLGLGRGLLPLLLSVLGSEVVLLVVVHPGVGLLDLLLDLLLHRLLLLLGHGRLEAVRPTVALLAALALLLSLLGILVLILAGTVVSLLAFLRHVNLLASLGYSLSLLVTLLRLELGQVNLPQDFEPRGGTLLRWLFLLGLRLLRLCLSLRLCLLLVSGFRLFLPLSGRKFPLVLAHRSLAATDILPWSRGCRLRGNVLDGFIHLFLRLGFGHDFLLRLLDHRTLLDMLCLGFRFRFLYLLLDRRLGLRLWLRLWFRLWLWLSHRLHFLFALRFRLFMNSGLRFRFRLDRSEDGCLDDSFPYRFILFLFGAFLLLSGCLFQNLVEFDVNLFRSLLVGLVLLELLVNRRKKILRDFHVRIGFDLNSLAGQKVHKFLKPDVVSLDDFI